MVSDTQYLLLLGKGLKLRRLSKLGSRSKRKLAALAGVSGTLIGKIEAGENNTGIIVLRRIAIALDCTVEELLPETC